MDEMVGMEKMILKVPEGPPGEHGETGNTGPPGSPENFKFLVMTDPWVLRGEMDNKDLRALQDQSGHQDLGVATSGGVVYTRWGKNSCPSTPGTEVVYVGRTGGTLYGHTGGGPNQLCMPPDPQYSNYNPGIRDFNYMYGAEYEVPVGYMSTKQNHDATCEVCFVSTHETVLMVPAKTSCLTSWTKEYQGYLMAEYRGNSGHSTFIVCQQRF